MRKFPPEKKCSGREKIGSAKLSLKKYKPGDTPLFVPSHRGWNDARDIEIRHYGGETGDLRKVHTRVTLEDEENY